MKCRQTRRANERDASLDGIKPPTRREGLREERRREARLVANYFRPLSLSYSMAIFFPCLRHERMFPRNWIIVRTLFRRVSGNEAGIRTNEPCHFTCGSAGALQSAAASPSPSSSVNASPSRYKGFACQSPLGPTHGALNFLPLSTSLISPSLSASGWFSPH